MEENIDNVENKQSDNVVDDTIYKEKKQYSFDQFNNIFNESYEPSGDTISKVDDNEYSEGNISTFVKILCKPGLDREFIKASINKYLLEFYRSKHRHFYYTIELALNEYFKGLHNRKYDRGEENFLEINIKIFYSVINDKEYVSIKASLLKLYDHCQLCAIRNKYLRKYFYELEKAENEITQIENKSRELARDIDSSKSDSITILSIFSAIMLAVLACIGFLDGSLRIISGRSSYYIVLVLCLVGMIMYNTVFMLIYMIARMTKKSIYSDSSRLRFYQSKNKSLTKFSENCWALKKIRIRLPYIFWVNAMLIMVMSVDFLLWLSLEFMPAWQMQSIVFFTLALALAFCWGRIFGVDNIK